MQKSLLLATKVTREKDSAIDNVRIEKRKPTTTIPLIITIIGIFCYLGVIVPSVFEARLGFMDYTIFDISIMVGSVALVALGFMFWFKARSRDILEDEQKLIEAY